MGSSPVTESDTAAREILQLDWPSVYDLQANIDRLTREIAFDENDQLMDLMRPIDLADQGSDEVYVTDEERDFYKRRRALLDMYRSSRALLQRFAVPERCYLGHVVFGSGFYRARRSREDAMPSIRDWALIQIAPKRLGKRNVCTSLRHLLLSPCSSDRD